LLQEGGQLLERQADPGGHAVIGDVAASLVALASGLEHLGDAGELRAQLGQLGGGGALVDHVVEDAAVGDQRWQRIAHG
jgi:hypothetical protein